MVPHTYPDTKNVPEHAILGASFYEWSMFVTHHRYPFALKLLKP